MNNRVSEVQGVLNKLLPAMEADGGGVELVSVEGDVVTVQFKGACLLCPSIGMTLKFGIIKTLKEKLPWIQEIVKQDNLAAMIEPKA